MIRLAFSTNAYLRFPFDEAAARIAAAGYEGLELMADVPHAWPAGLLDGPKRAIQDAMQRHGLEFSNVNAFMMNAVADHRQPYWYPSFIEPDEGYRRVRIDHTRRAIDLCAELGAPHITTEPGGPMAPGQSRPSAIDLFVEVLKPLAEHAHNEGVLLLIEPEPELLLETTDQYLEIAERLNAPSIGLNFDVGH
ncbi:MAG TPA: sugar phosphate isomerase/epimerase family protein, partial [Isosphaeraceae bacterium]